MDQVYFYNVKNKAQNIYISQRKIFNPYLACDVIFNSDGWHHLQFSDRHERKKEEQVLKFRLLPLAIEIIKKSNTLQEYRKTVVAIEKKDHQGFRPLKLAEYWGFVAIVGKDPIKVKVILKRIGKSNVIFWSVMPDSKTNPTKLVFESEVG